MVSSYDIAKIDLLGQSLALDFTKSNVAADKIEEETIKVITKTLNKEIKQSHKVENASCTSFYLQFDDGYTTVSLFKNGMITVETRLFTPSEQSERDIIALEISFCDAFGWENNSGNAYFQRGGSHYHLLNKYYHSEALYKNFQLIHREQTQYQDLRVYDTKDLGRILSLDYMVQNSDLVRDDNYTIDLCNLVLDKSKSYENILLIGAGDMIIPDYLLRLYNIKKITLVEIDDRVIENTKKYFKFYENIDKYISEGKLDVIIDDGAKYLRERLSFGEIYDGIIIDNSDVYLFDGPAANLFTKEFYSNILSLLKSGGAFSQQVSDEIVKAKWIDMIKSVGFEKTAFLYSTTPEYATCIPMASAIKN